MTDQRELPLWEWETIHTIPIELLSMLIHIGPAIIVIRTSPVGATNIETGTAATHTGETVPILPRRHWLIQPKGEVWISVRGLMAVEGVMMNAICLLSRKTCIPI